DGIIHGKNALPLDMFFAPIEDGRVDVPPERFVDLFIHSYLALVIDNKISALGNARNGLGKSAELAIKNFIDAENEIYDCNAVRAESLCMARIDAEDDDFDFLAVDKGINTSLRVMFRNYAKAILKLKKCFILSPSTASVLFRGEAYENFDVVIVDEASQMEPVDLLPVLFRSKQCVLVGDEFQMPPLAHFKAKNRKRISDEATELTLDVDISALSLALGNLAFETEELVCHYRSKTESLIEFSQREFYPYMRTFPATVPATPDLGFTDILVEDGYCEDGVNVPEANAVIAALHEHFDKYYDEKKGTLSTSVGVVTFGEAQLKYVLSLVRADKKLHDRIENAWRNFDDVPDKLVFFRTIESVQGQETDNLILSLTYGRDKNGKVKLAFGELNRDATGKNIFNVAVTRAKNKVTVIHTLTSRQMAGNDRIAFIRSYLAGVERFAEKASQFVSAVPEKGEHFISAVASYIESLGIAKERIVTDYGVTDGSVRIPIAVLSKDLTTAELGLWCEMPVQKKYDYFDYNARYVTSLTGRGWILHKVHIHDYFDNVKAEQAAIKAAVQKYVTK
ncbi:MAG: DNA2/NAM7 family helicase, partial [Clostridiales bacterium]|nr:DNA2/NAM7 family helicase [Clostridiales bacterium]